MSYSGNHHKRRQPPLGGAKAAGTVAPRLPLGGAKDVGTVAPRQLYLEDFNNADISFC